MNNSFFNKFPTVNELLDSPPLKSILDRANRNVVVTNVKSFVGRMATDLQNRAADIKIPSVSELAERIADWIARERAAGPLAEINATGILLPENASLPLAEEALHALQATLRDYTHHAAGDQIAAGQQQVNELLCALTGAEAALVTATHSGALLLSLAATCGDKPALIARGQVGEIDPGIPLPKLAQAAGVALRECGTVERAQLDDYQRELPGVGCLLTVASSRYAIAGDSPTPAVQDLAALARGKQIPLLADLGLGGLFDVEKYGLANLPHAQAAVGGGADLVILSGDRLLGGPSCGIVLGKSAAIHRLRSHPLMPVLTAGPLVLLPLAATLQLYQDLETAERTIPLLSLLTTAVENLRSRAERLAPQCAASPLVESATPRAGSATLLGKNLPGQQLPTWQVVVHPQGLTAPQLAEKLRRASVPIAATVEGDTVLLDMRTVFPRQDMQIVEAFLALSPPAADSTQPQSKEPVTT